MYSPPESRNAAGGASSSVAGAHAAHIKRRWTGTSRIDLCAAHSIRVVLLAEKGLAKVVVAVKRPGMMREVKVGVTTATPSESNARNGVARRREPMISKCFCA